MAPPPIKMTPGLAKAKALGVSITRPAAKASAVSPMARSLGKQMMGIKDPKPAGPASSMKTMTSSIMGIKAPKTKKSGGNPMTALQNQMIGKAGRKK